MTWDNSFPAGATLLRETLAASYYWDLWLRGKIRPQNMDPLYGTTTMLAAFLNETAHPVRVKIRVLPHPTASRTVRLVLHTRREHLVVAANAVRPKLLMHTDKPLAEGTPVRGLWAPLGRSEVLTPGLTQANAHDVLLEFNSLLVAVKALAELAVAAGEP